jgi:hypothetical protein
MTDAEQIGRRAEQSDALDHLVRAGLVAYAVVHLLVGWLAVQLAMGDQSENASAQGALAELARQPFGEVLVWAVAVGLFLLVLWRLLEAGFGHRDAEGADRVRQRLVSGGKAVIYGVVCFTATKVALSGGGSGGSQSEETLTARLMDLPAGQWIVVAVGLAIIGYGGNYVRRGWTEKFAEHLETEGRLGWSGAAYLLLGKVGHIAKGVALALVGVLFVYAGATHEPGKSGGLDEALQTLLRQPFGPVLLIAIGAGIACYGLFCLARARHLDR